MFIQILGHLLGHQEQILSQKTKELCGIQNMLRIKKQKLEVGISTDISEITIVQRKESLLLVSDPFTAFKSEVSNELWLAFYLKCKENRIALGYLEGFLVSKDDLLCSKTMVANQIICHVGNDAYANSFMPKGTFLTAWGQGGFADTEPVYHRILRYIEENHITIIYCKKALQ